MPSSKRGDARSGGRGSRRSRSPRASTAAPRRRGSAAPGRSRSTRASCSRASGDCGWSRKSSARTSRQRSQPARGSDCAHLRVQVEDPPLPVEELELGHAAGAGSVVRRSGTSCRNHVSANESTAMTAPTRNTGCSAAANACTYTSCRCGGRPSPSPARPSSGRARPAAAPSRGSRAAGWRRSRRRRRCRPSRRSGGT